jgi:L-ascorbate metabolism protein UlaG (beta-lactamase superfamily)
MTIQKFLHSCLLITEKGERLVVDPGGWSSPVKEIGGVNVIVITHEHQDHFNLEKIKEFLALQTATIISNGSVAKLLAAENIPCTVVEGGDTHTTGTFVIRGIAAPHATLPVAAPLNVAYVLNETLLVTGDSFNFEMPPSVRVLTLPIAAPWGTATEAVHKALALRPAHVIPVHEGVLNPAFAPRVIQMCGNVLTAAGINYHPLTPGETLEV